ncbi:hypothetical protein Bpfe_011960, partial [Biomphalaria pfeifferi]
NTVHPDIHVTLPPRWHLLSADKKANNVGTVNSTGIFCHCSVRMLLDLRRLHSLLCLVLHHVFTYGCR